MKTWMIGISVGLAVAATTVRADPPEVLYVEGTAAQIHEFANTGRWPGGGPLRLVGLPSGNFEAYTSSCIDNFNRALIRQVSPGVWETTQVFNPRTLFCAIQHYDNAALRRDQATLLQHLTVVGGGDTLHGVLSERYTTAPRELPPQVMAALQRGNCTAILTAPSH